MMTKRALNRAADFAMEDYLRARELAGTESLGAMATQYGEHFGSATRFPIPQG